MREVHSLVWFFKERKGSIWWRWLLLCLLPLPVRLFSSLKAVQRIHTCTHTHMLLSLLRCLNDCSGQQLPSQSPGKLVFHQQTLWEASGLPHCCFRFCYFFLFSCRKFLKRRSPVPHRAFQNHFKYTLLGWDSCFSLLRKKEKKGERVFLLLFFFHPTGSLLKGTCVSTSDQGFTAGRQHLSYHQQPPSLTLQPFPSTWEGCRAEGITSVSLCSSWGQIPGSITPCCSLPLKKRGYNDTFISRSQKSSAPCTRTSCWWLLGNLSGKPSCLSS